MNNTQNVLALGEQPQINTSGVDMNSVIQEYRLAKQFVEQYTRDFKDLDNLVDGVPIKREGSDVFVGDTTLAGLVRSIPRDSLQQLPVFSVEVNGTKNSVTALTATYLLKKFALNEDTFGKGLLSTLQIGAEQAITHGYAPFMVATGTMFSEFGTKLRLLHFADVAVEPGITDGDEMGYSYNVANLTTSRVRKILKAAEANPDTSWNVEALKQLLQSTPRQTNYSIYQSDPRRNSTGENISPTYEFITRNETGPDGTIITFCLEIEDKPLRVMKSNSKFGYPRTMLLVIDPAPLTPFGLSRVRLASPNQNLMNVYYGHIAAMLLLNSKPPILKRGRFTKPVQLKQGAIWEALDQNASADLKTIDNGALAQFTPFAEYFTGQIQNIMGRPSGPSGPNSRFSKVGPGVKQQNDVMDNSTNQITKILENFLRQYALVSLDTLLSEQSGTEELIVDDDTKNAINNIAPGTVGDNNRLEMQWEEFYQSIEQWSVHVDVSLSKDEIDEKKRGDLQDMLVVLAQNAQELGPDAVEKVKEITNILMQDNAPTIKPLSLAPAAAPMAAGPMPPQAQPQPLPNMIQ